MMRSDVTLLLLVLLLVCLQLLEHLLVSENND
jgi:hypothetical protein